MKYVIIALGIIFVIALFFVMLAICKTASLCDEAEQNAKYINNERSSNYDNYSQEKTTR